MSAADAQFQARVQDERDYLLRFATLQLRDAAAAADAVQETLLAALQGRESYAGRSSLRTWLTGILKHKIVDAIRRAAREVVMSGEDEGDGSEFDRLFDANGHWASHPEPWDDPDAALSREQFFSVLEKCLAKLPAKTARVFMMREHLGCDTEDICKETGVTPTHCWVLLYRARMALQQCLNANWFEK